MAHTHTHLDRESDHRTSFQLQSHHVAHTSHKDTDNTMQPKQPLLMDIQVEPFPQSSSHADCDVLQLGKPGQHFTATGNTRARAMLIRHIISLSKISTSKFVLIYLVCIDLFLGGGVGSSTATSFFLLQAMIAYHMHSKHVCIICTPKSISAYKLHTE